MATRTCAFCGISFQLKPYWKHNRLTCSDKCRYALTSSKLINKEAHTGEIRSRVTRICVQCGAPFTVAPSSRKKLCSQPCKVKYVGKVNTGANNPNWKEVKYIRPTNKRSLRTHIKARDKVCQDCGSSKSLQVHHVDSDPSNNADSNLVLLCKPCHADRHAAMGEPQLVGLILVNRTYPQLPPRNCVICGESFKPKHKSTQCCSVACAALQSGKTRSKLSPRTCIICRATFTPTRMNKVCCSLVCSRSRPHNGKPKSP